MKKRLTVLAVLVAAALVVSGFAVPSMAAEIAEPVTQSDAVTIVREDESLRGEYEKHFLMSDGTYQAVVYNDPVHKLEDGTWVEIDNTLSLQSSGRYATADGLTDVTFAGSFGDELVTMQKDGYSLSWGVAAVSDSLHMSATAQAQLVAEDLSGLTAQEQVTLAAKSASAIRYSNALGQNVDLEYTVLPTRVKESIILQSQRDISAYIVTVYAENLSVRLLESRQIEFYNENDDVIFTMAAPYMYDSAGALSEEITVELASKGSGVYFVSIAPSQSWLNDESRVYPVTIDPDVSTDSDRMNILDNYVMEGYGVQNNNLDRLYIGTKSGSLCRGFIQFKTMPTIPEGATINYATMTLNILEGTAIARNASAFMVEEAWVSGELQWSNQPDATIVLEENISHNNQTGFVFSCSTAVRHWYDGDPTGMNENYGIMVRYYDETLINYNSFYSADCSVASKRPAIAISYWPPSEDASVLEGYTCTLTAPEADGTITWSSNDTTIATVDANGVVTGIKAGQTTVTAFVNGTAYQWYRIYVRLADGVYYIERANTGLYIGTDGSIAENTPVQIVASAATELEQIRQLWRITYLGNGYYSIRPLHNLSMALCSTDGTVNITTIGTTDTLDGVPNVSKWTIEYDTDGYLFKYVGTSSMVMRCSAPYPTASVITESYSSEIASFKWTLTKVEDDISGVCLYDTYNNFLVTDVVTKYVEYNIPTSLDSLNLKPVVYSIPYLNQSFTWVVQDPTIASIDRTAGTITGLKTGTTTVTGIPQAGSTEKVSFNIIVIGSEQYTAGVRITTINGAQYYDYTIAINQLFENAVELCGENRCLNWTQYCTMVSEMSPLAQPSISEHAGMQLASILWFYEQVHDGAPWDIKLEDNWKAAMPNVPYLGMNAQFVFRGVLRSAHEMGNIMYGYTGRATGIGSITLYWGGGVANQKDAGNEEVVTPPYYGDNEDDHYMIEYGYNLFETDYPNYPEVGYDGIPAEGWIADIAYAIVGAL